jgi:hypothetical protein
MKISFKYLSTNAFALLFVTLLLLNGCDRHQEPGAANDFVTPAEIVADKYARQQSAIENAFQTQDTPTINRPRKPILFGDLHVHTTFSPDAFITALPIMGGGGSRPPAMACDFARYCSALDFWSINDHAEGLTPLRWQETKDAVRECNAISNGASSNGGNNSNNTNNSEPDLVTFLGWEWSQVSHYNAKQHYGHKNVIFLDTEDDKVPSRPIAAPRDQLGKAPMGALASNLLALRDFKNRAYYQGIQQYYDEIAETPKCAKDIDSRQLPDDCHETAKDPQTLFAKLNQWGFKHMVIPHGNAWGLNTPPGTTFDKQLNLAQHSPEQQFLFELYSGHGNSEEYRDWRAVAYDIENRAYCPSPSDNYEPCCWRAGKIIRERCDSAGIDQQECQQRELLAQQNFIDAGVSGHLTVPGQTTNDWLNCGQCDDCFNAGMDHRPGTTAQYAMAITHFDEQQKPLNFRFGFIGSSDNHSARAGTGYKELGRLGSTEAHGVQSKKMIRQLANDKREPHPYSIPLSEMSGVGLNRKRNMERQASFWLTGGLVAVHSDNRQREAIWQGLSEKEVYATSGDRILLWFDLVEQEKVYPMGSSVSSAIAPQFQVKAIGDYQQLPGCPSYIDDAIDAEQLESLCRGECYNPGDTRKVIEKIEIVRIRPQAYPNEPLENLIEDPWQSFECPANQSSCEVSFTDVEFTESNRQTLYYARAIQQASPAINAGGLRCTRDANGVCIDVDPCYGDFRTDSEDDCLAPNRERAWSSPIFVYPSSQ